MDDCAGSLPTAMACMTIPCHRRGSCRDIDEKAVRRRYFRFRMFMQDKH